jgi:hypothetical protein
MKEALDRLKDLIDREERLVVATAYGMTQQLTQSSGRMEQKIESFGRTFEELKTAEQSKWCGVAMVSFLTGRL